MGAVGVAPGKRVICRLLIMNHPGQTSSLNLSFPISQMLGLGLEIFKGPRAVLPTRITLF